ncbi:Phospholipid methyltransferase [Penicillium longicatenatum]|uniref:Phospholipid methyltransferase n=1 Tax=Penicillium longicatenatum TaxID=1561947 RepID=UPI0025472ADD|nr:Phospholipid methyltransferase [Penicillium longicatenatum]KAJ5639670.1 Phospholipid methyltransferase [Penicillium longicatenatum]
MAESASTVLAISMITAAYLAMLSATPPNPTPEKKYRHNIDRISFISGNFSTVARRICVAAVGYHGFLVGVAHYAPGRILQSCPLVRNTNPELFVWNQTSVTALLLIYVGTYVRLSAYNDLGECFTFHLAPPSRLVTTRIYSWIQHPSYTGLAMICLGSAFLFLRWDATPACWIPETFLSQLAGSGLGISVAVMGGVIWTLAMRVRDEEDMLRQKFGGEWEDWHRSTKRFIPGLL